MVVLSCTVFVLTFFSFIADVYDHARSVLPHCTGAPVVRAAITHSLT